MERPTLASCILPVTLKKVRRSLRHLEKDGEAGAHWCFYMIPIQFIDEVSHVEINVHSRLVVNGPGAALCTRLEMLMALVCIIWMNVHSQLVVDGFGVVLLRLEVLT